MEQITAADANKRNQLVESDKKKTESKPEATKSSDFETLFTRLVSPDQANMISEEELFAGAVGNAISELKGAEEGAKFEGLSAEASNGLKRPDGFFSYEDAAVGALKSMVSQGLLTKEEGDKIYSESFRAAQLDDNLAKLYDGRGGPNDTTVAVMEEDKALASVSSMIKKIAAGDMEVKSLSLGSGAVAANTKTTGSGGAVVGGSRNPVDGAEGFLFKPEGEHSKKLVVLLPTDLASRVEKLELRDITGEPIEEGAFSGNANGGRDHFRLSKAGSAYPAGVIVSATLNDGQIVTWEIPDPNQRYD